MPDSTHEHEAAKAVAAPQPGVALPELPAGATSSEAAILVMQRKVGNRAVSGLISASRRSSLVRGGIQRAPAQPGSGDRDRAATSSADAIRSLIKSTVERYRNEFKPVPDDEADKLIELVETYVKSFPDHIVEVAQAEELFDLLAPWGFKGGGQVGRDEGRAVAKIDVGVTNENLERALRAWRGQDKRARKKSRRQTKTVMGSYTKERSAAQIEWDETREQEEQLETGQVYAGPKRAMRVERDAAHAQVVMNKVGAVETEGAGGFLGMVTGAGIGAMAGKDVMWSAEVGMMFGNLFDPFFTRRAMHSDKQGQEAEARDRAGSQAPTPPPISGKASVQERMPTPDLPAGKSGGGSSGGGAGSAGSAGGAGGSAPATLPGLGFDGRGPEVPGSDTLPGLGFDGRGPAGRTGVTSKGMGAAGTPAPGGAPKTQPGYAPGPGAGPSSSAPSAAPSTQSGYAPGPGGSSGRSSGGPVDPALADTGKATGGPGRTPQPNPYGYQGFWSGLGLPDYPSPAPKGSAVNPATPQEVLSIFQQRPDKVIVGSSPKFHEFRWQLLRWKEGRPTTEKAPMAFHAENGYVHVDADQWREQVGDPRKILKP